MVVDCGGVDRVARKSFLILWFVRPSDRGFGSSRSVQQSLDFGPSLKTGNRRVKSSVMNAQGVESIRSVASRLVGF